MGKTKELSKDVRDKIIDLHRQGWNELQNHKEDEAIGLAQEYLRCKELKAGTRTPSKLTFTDPIKEFLAQAMESPGQLRS